MRFTFNDIVILLPDTFYIATRESEILVSKANVESFADYYVVSLFAKGDCLVVRLGDKKTTNTVESWEEEFKKATGNFPSFF
ncbi:MAG: hypothetical protein GX103_00070 [Bacteroidales bacterium]|nr:hypothetical protein [Bacteroidales bacterium]